MNGSCLCFAVFSISSQPLGENIGTKLLEKPKRKCTSWLSYKNASLNLISPNNQTSNAHNSCPREEFHHDNHYYPAEQIYRRDLVTYSKSLEPKVTGLVSNVIPSNMDLIYALVN